MSNQSIYIGRTLDRLVTWHTVVPGVEGAEMCWISDGPGSEGADSVLLDLNGLMICGNRLTCERDIVGILFRHLPHHDCSSSTSTQPDPRGGVSLTLSSARGRRTISAVCSCNAIMAEIFNSYHFSGEGNLFITDEKCKY